MSITPRQREVLAFIEDVQERTGVMPSSREIQKHFGFASQTAALNHLRALERKGVIVRQPGKARAVAISAHLRRNPIVDIPFYGTIAAGGPEPQESQPSETISVDMESAGLKKNSRMFALKVRGDSMTGAHISDGDLVILEQKISKNGDIVAAKVDGEMTLKRYVTTEGRPFLRAENPKYPDIHSVSELTIEGVMVALIRKSPSGD